LEGSQYLIYEWLHPFATEVTQDAQPKIVDAHFQNGAVTIWVTLLPRRAANMLAMDSPDHVTIQLPYLQHPKSLTLH